MNEFLPLEHNMYGAENSTLRKTDQNYLEIFEMWYWKWMEKVIWTDGAKNEEVLHIVKDERNWARTIKWRKANWIFHILCRNYLLKYVVEGRREETEGGGRSCKQLRDNFKKL